MFSKQAPTAAGTAPPPEEPGWRESLYRVYKSGHQSMRVAIYGCKHDAALFEELLQACPHCCCLLSAGCAGQETDHTCGQPRLQA